MDRRIRETYFLSDYLDLLDQGHPFNEECREATLKNDGATSHRVSKCVSNIA